MKKLLLMMIVLLVSGAVIAQGNTGKTTTKNFLAFHAGPSFPVGNFVSTNLDNDQSGYAKNGYTLNLDYGYQIVQGFGLAASLSYNNNKMDNKAIQISTDDQLLELDHWQWYSLAVGPMLTQKLSDNISGNLRVMGGVAYANSPKAVYDGELIVDQDWSYAGLFKVGLGVHFELGDNLFLMVNADYQYTKPRFDIVIPEESPTQRSQQIMTTINVTGGIGFRF